MTNSTGATAEMSKESTCTISVVPTLAPSMMASAGTRLTTPSAAKRSGHQPGRGAALHDRGQHKSGAERLEAIAQRPGKHAAQIGTERAQHAGEDHVQAPQQQRHAAHQIKQNNRSHRVTGCGSRRAIGAFRPAGKLETTPNRPVDDYRQRVSLNSAVLTPVGLGRFMALAKVNCVPVSEAAPVASPKSLFAFVECKAGDRIMLTLISALIPFPEIDNHVVAGCSLDHRRRSVRIWRGSLPCSRNAAELRRMLDNCCRADQRQQQANDIHLQ